MENAVIVPTVKYGHKLIVKLQLLFAEKFEQLILENVKVWPLFTGTTGIETVAVPETLEVKLTVWEVPPFILYVAV